jgi:cyclopropane-fatty-acyl-phospholipid synthase
MVWFKELTAKAKAGIMIARLCHHRWGAERLDRRTLTSGLQAGHARHSDHRCRTRGRVARQLNGSSPSTVYIEQLLDERAAPLGSQIALSSRVHCSHTNIVWFNGTRAHKIMANKLTPHFADVQAHYDLSDDFFRLFLDPTQTYSCAYFEREDMTLEEAQIAKIDLALGKLGLQPGMTLLDVGCGWGSTMRRAIEKYDVNVVGLTLSKNQAAHVQRSFDQMDSPRRRRVLLNGWEQFGEPVDRIVSIGAFEHFGPDRYDDFFKAAHNILPVDGVMLLHTITGLTEQQMIESGLPITVALVQFIKFILTEIFPGGFTPTIEMAKEHSAKAGLTLTRQQSLQRHYARTLDLWAEALEAHESEAIEIQSQEVYERYMKYLTGCAKMFRIGYIDVNQFTLEK